MVNYACQLKIMWYSEKGKRYRRKQIVVFRQWLLQVLAEKEAVAACE